MDDMPDLSHLTPEERAIIEDVIMRQRQEEQREHEIMRCAFVLRPASTSTSSTTSTHPTRYTRVFQLIAPYVTML
ncbi:unnamed protein product [Euphydryas editha]|uniref:RabBD domain-containing protein n=1 Tax=Euphydryas editha TaxID=104508 RepID=A0AAU9UJZ4_EUPED|nr:unnamed protein product [Euphydryas editha]